MFKSIFLSTVFLLISVMSIADSGLDLKSLDKLNSLEKVERIEKLFEVSNYYMDRNLDSARLYATQLTSLVQNDSPYNRFRAFRLMGVLNSNFNGLSLAIKYYNKARKELLKIENSSIDESLLYNDIGIIYFKQEKYSDALEWFKKSLNIAKDHGQAGDDYLATLNIGAVYEKLNSDSLSLSFYHEYEKLLLEKGFEDEGQLGNLYNSLGSFYLDRDSLEKAKLYFTKANEEYGKSERQVANANCITNLAIIDFLEGNIEVALEGFKEALKIRMDFGKPQLISESYLNLGDFYFRQGDNVQAIKYFNYAYDYGVEANSIESVKDANSYQIALYEKLNTTEKVVQSLIQLSKDIEKIQDINLEAQIEELDFYRDVESGDEVLQALGQEDEVGKSSTLVVVLIIFCGLLSGSTIYLVATRKS